MFALFEVNTKTKAHNLEQKSIVDSNPDVDCCLTDCTPCLTIVPVQWSFVAADGVEMPLEEGTSCFITMNPGYIGRAELPESLKALFRPITVMVPDRQLIMENMLMAEGFVEAKNLAKKFASLYYLLEDLLSPQVGDRQRGAGMQDVWAQPCVIDRTLRMPWYLHCWVHSSHVLLAMHHVFHSMPTC
jgi:hypothetical protein